MELSVWSAQAEQKTGQIRLMAQGPSAQLLRQLLPPSRWRWREEAAGTLSVGLTLDNARWLARRLRALEEQALASQLETATLKLVGYQLLNGWMAGHSLAHMEAQLELEPGAAEAQLRDTLRDYL